MEEQATFEAIAVLAPRRARVARLALLVPVVVLVAIAWAGLNGPRSDSTALASTRPTTVALPSQARPSLAVEAAYPAEANGLAVQRLGELQIGRLGFDSVVAIAGWYVPMVITDCPPLAAIDLAVALPYLRGDADKLAFCVRSGMLYASRPDVPSDRSPEIVPTGVAVTVVVGVIMPGHLETVGASATQVVVIGRFGKSGDGCRTGVGCSRELVIDQVAWTPDVLTGTATIE